MKLQNFAIFYFQIKKIIYGLYTCFIYILI